MANIAAYFAQHLATPDRLLYRRYADATWSDVSVGELAALVGRWQAALESLRFEPGDRIAICLRNSVEWVALDLAALGLGAVVVPLYVDDNPDNVAWCASNAEARALVVENTRLGQALAATGASLPALYVLRPDAGDRLAPASALLPAAAGAPRFVELPDDALATICYTSGTSGRPKGVMLSHGNIIANVTSCRQTGMAHQDDVFLSILPLSHMFERTGGYYLPLSLGARVVFSRGVALLADDLAAQSPTVIFAVPRIFEKFLARIAQALAASPARRWLFEQCATRGWRVEQGRAGWLDALAVPWLRKRVATPILARLGGRLRVAIVGGAALDPLVSHVFIGLGLPMLQGYGMTEASPVISVNQPGDNDPESVGPPLPGVEVKIAETGELLCRGGNVMQGYWRNPEATRAAIDADRWLRTGDLARIRDGRIYIGGRLKDIMVMSNGEKFSPQDAELALLHDPTFEQVLLVGEGRPFLTLLAVTGETDEKALVRRANELLKDFPRWVRVRRAIATSDAWTVDNGLLTPTLKLRRPLVLARYQPHIDAVYAADAS
ncbi:MAG TPA: AMP-dependent synthetase/ligase [Casimicrobiaceae bacterium]|nr:AMP-dependent synthetase/ligase [Casimicrobiaceae bacterium]